MNLSPDISAQFPILGELDFFNHAGVSPVSGPAAAQLRAFADQASRRSYIGGRWHSRIQQVRQSAARLIGAASPEEVAFVSNTSSGLAQVARGLTWFPGDRVVITNVEFPANRYCWEDLRRRGVELVEVPERDDGRIDVEDVIEAITDRTRLVAISHVQYGSGYRIDLKPISDVVHQAGGYLCVDAIQSVGALPVDVRALGVDFLSADGHKWMLGPEGAGIFYCRADLCQMLDPLAPGWNGMVNANDYGNYRFEYLPDARRFEPGSYNVAGILALGASLDLLLSLGMTEVWSRLEALTDRLCALLAERGCEVFSPRNTGEKSGIVSFLPPTGAPPLASIVSDLEKRGIVIVARSGRLRASPHFYNTIEQVERLVAALPW